MLHIYGQHSLSYFSSKGPFIAVGSCGHLACWKDRTFRKLHSLNSVSPVSEFTPSKMIELERLDDFVPVEAGGGGAMGALIIMFSIIQGTNSS